MSGALKEEMGSGILKEEERTIPPPSAFLSLSKDYITAVYPA